MIVKELIEPLDRLERHLFQETAKRAFVVVQRQAHALLAEQTEPTEQHLQELQASTARVQALRASILENLQIDRENAAERAAEKARKAEAPCPEN